MKISPIQVTQTKLSTTNKLLTSEKASTSNSTPSFKGIWGGDGYSTIKRIKKPDSGFWPWQKSYRYENEYYPFADESKRAVNRAKKYPPSRQLAAYAKKVKLDQIDLVDHKTYVRKPLTCTEEEAKQYIKDPNSVSDTVYAELTKFKEKYFMSCNNDLKNCIDSEGGFREEPSYCLTMPTP